MSDKYSIKLPPQRQDVDGGYLIKNVTILAEGNWNEIEYRASVLESSQYNWRDNAIWNRHYEGRQRDEKNRIGIIKNQHYEDRSIKGDVFLSDSTDEGKEMIHFVRTNQINGISVEHVSKDIGDVAVDISFMGAAIVPTPACTICQLSKEEYELKQEDFDKLSDTVTELAKSVKELTTVDVKNIVKEQSDKDQKIIEELSARIKKLEKVPKTNNVTVTNLKDGYSDIATAKGAISGGGF